MRPPAPLAADRALPLRRLLFTAREARGPLSPADPWIAATAAVRDAVLVRDDRELTRVRQVRQEHLRN